MTNSATAFDTPAVEAWIRRTTPALVPPFTWTQLPGGHSNLTFLIQDTLGAKAVIRRPPTGPLLPKAHDMGREYRIQSALKEPFGLVPTMLAQCEDESVIGAPFYVMERIDGLIPRSELGFDLSLDDTRALCTNMLDVLVKLNQTDVDRQVMGWTARYRAARTPDAADFEAVMNWLIASKPDDVDVRVIHNDFRFDNLVLSRDHPTEVIGVLDWEMATLGDPLMDLAGSLAYWVQADDDAQFASFRRQPTHLPGMLTRAEVVDYYCSAMGYSVSPEQWRFYEVFGLFRLAVIAQQIYYRYFHKQTTNDVYAIFGPVAVMLEARCRKLIG